MKPSAEQIRIRYLYRRKILNGEVEVSHKTAKKLVGPDTAYHLYGKHGRSKVHPSTGSGQASPKSKKKTV